ncbi:hypothetical protein EUGRSUZ_J01310 [Eucalyptus grandis]|uniref:Uncharacterized protein n=2 Tax=Eucalyptus grandis TaxID=71139 RepID=A0ACC3JZQ6_EUCGR|nr:hypothetical protein EUGRSUZ_J01310 [Eucalyptus grandis]
MTGQPRNQGIIRDKSPLRHFIEQDEGLLEIAYPSIYRYDGVPRVTVLCIEIIKSLVGGSDGRASGVHANEMVDEERVAGECGLDEVFLGDASCDERDIVMDGWDDIAEEHGNASVVSPMKKVSSASYHS